MTIMNNNENKNNKNPGNSIFAMDLGAGKQGYISSPGSTSDHINTGSQNKEMPQSAGAPGSAGIVGSKRWIAAHTDKSGNISTKSD